LEWGLSCVRRIDFYLKLGIGDWGLGIEDWGLGISDFGLRVQGFKGSRVQGFKRIVTLSGVEAG